MHFLPCTHTDDGVEDGLAGSDDEDNGEEAEGQQQQQQHVRGGDASSGDDGDEAAEASAGQQKGFLEGGKAASFAKAFAKILGTSGKRVVGPGGAVATGAGAVGVAAAPPILAASKSFAKRKAESAAEQRQDKEAKKLRQDMKQRGHVVSEAVRFENSVPGFLHMLLP